VGESSFEELIRATRQRHAAQRAAAAAASTAAAAAAAAPDAAAAAPPAAQPDALASTPARDAARTSADGAEAAAEAPVPASGAAGAWQPAAARPADGVAHPAAGGQGDLPAAREQPAADLDTWGSRFADAAAAAPAQDASPAHPVAQAHPAAQPLLDEQSRSASRSLEPAAAAAQHMRSSQQDLAAANSDERHSDDGAYQQADRFSEPSGIADVGHFQQELHRQPFPEQEAAGQRPEAALDMDAAASGDSLDAALPGGMTCTQQPYAGRQQEAAQDADAAAGKRCLDAALPGNMTCTQQHAQLGPALSCGQQLQLQQPFTFEGVFSDDSRSCPLSPSV
jgi:trimeric autotransporter adhesin